MLRGRGRRARGRPRKNAKTTRTVATDRRKHRSTSVDSAVGNIRAATAGRPPLSPTRATSADASRRGHVKVSSTGARVTYSSWLAQQNAARDSRRRRRSAERMRDEETLAQEHRRVTAELARTAEATSAAAALMQRPARRPVARPQSARGRGTRPARTPGPATRSASTRRSQRLRASTAGRKW